MATTYKAACVSPSRLQLDVHYGFAGVLNGHATARFAFRALGRHGSLSTLKTACELGLKFNHSAKCILLSGAIESGSIEKADWCHGIKHWPLDGSAGLSGTISDSIPMMEWLLAHKVTFNTVDCTQQAAQSGSLLMLRWFNTTCRL